MALLRYFWILLFVFFALSLFAQHMDFRPREEGPLLAQLEDHSNPRMRWTLIDARVKDFSEELLPFEKDLLLFEPLHYQRLHLLVFEKNMVELQQLVAQGKLSYEDLTLYFLCRIWKYERDPATRLNALISLNPKVLEQARLCDQNREEGHSLLYGMPILLKDNINTVDMPTTAGAALLLANETEDAFLVKRLKEAGALILGKTNLSEWAYYFCAGCPVGYSAVGGQTLNPYGPMVYESGGSSSGSGAAMAARYAVAAVGTETSGSILSPSAQNALVGLKPTVGLISRSGIVPISTSLDTPGPMTLNLLDNMILFAAMMGRDAEDPRSVELEDFMVAMQNKIGKIRLGMPSMLLRDSSILVWAQSLNQGNLEIIALEEPSPALDGFRSILDGEMPQALAHYFEKYAHGSFRNWTLDTLINKNQADKALFAPYGQQLFEYMAANSLSDQEVETIFQNLQKVSQAYFSRQKETLKLDAFLSINNYHAALAAVAHAPCLTLPLGRRPHGEPFNLTLIGESKEEKRLFEIGWMLESMLASRGYPDLYRN